MSRVLSDLVQRSPKGCEDTQSDTNSNAYFSFPDATKYYTTKNTPGHYGFNLPSSAYISSENSSFFSKPKCSGTNGSQGNSQPVSLAELRDSFQNFSQAEKRQINERKYNEQRKTVKLKMHMRVLPIREHNNIRYYPVVDPLNKGKRYLMCGHCCIPHLFGHFENMKRHLKRCKSFLDYCRVNNTAAMDPQHSDNSYKEKTQRLDPLSSRPPGIMVLDDDDEPKTIFNKYDPTKPQHLSRPEQFSFNAVKSQHKFINETQPRSIMNDLRGVIDFQMSDEMKSDLCPINTRENEMPHSADPPRTTLCPISSTGIVDETSFTQARFPESLMPFSKNPSLSHTDDASNSVSRSIIENNLLDSKQQCTENVSSKISMGIQTNASYLKKKAMRKGKKCSDTITDTKLVTVMLAEKKDKTIEDCFENTEKGSKSILTTTRSTGCILRSTSHLIQQRRESVTSPVGSGRETENSPNSLCLSLSQHFPNSEPRYSSGDIVWIQTTSNFWPVLVLNGVKSGSRKKILYLVYLLGSCELRICSESSLKSWSSGLKSWRLLSATARRSDKTKVKAFNTAETLLRKKKTEILAQLRIPQAIYLHAYRLLLQGTQQWLSLDGSALSELPIICETQNGVADDGTLFWQRRRYGVHSLSCSPAKSQKQALMTFLSGRINGHEM